MAYQLTFVCNADCSCLLKPPTNDGKQTSGKEQEKLTKAPTPKPMDAYIYSFFSVVRWFLVLIIYSEFAFLKALNSSSIFFLFF